MVKMEEAPSLPETQFIDANRFLKSLRVRVQNSSSNPCGWSRGYQDETITAFKLNFRIIVFVQCLTVFATNTV
jgi:hypothetical protein